MVRLCRTKETRTYTAYFFGRNGHLGGTPKRSRHHPRQGKQRIDAFWIKLGTRVQVQEGILCTQSGSNSHTTTLPLVCTSWGIGIATHLREVCEINEKVISTQRNKLKRDLQEREKFLLKFGDPTMEDEQEGEEEVRFHDAPLPIVDLQVTVEAHG